MGQRNWFMIVLLVMLARPLAGQAQEDGIQLEVAEEISWSQDMATGLSYLLSPIVKNKSSGRLQGLSLLVDGSDYVDNDLTVQLGDLNPGEMKQVDVGSIFNEFILSWHGETPLTLTLELRGLGPAGDWFSKMYEVPVRYHDTPQVKMKSRHANRTVVHVSTITEQKDILGNEVHQPASPNYQATMARGEAHRRWLMPVRQQQHYLPGSKRQLNGRFCLGG